jgi:hypothetical protein
MKIKRILAFIMFLLLFVSVCSAQKIDSLPFLKNTEFIGKVYSNFHTYLNKQSNGFDVTRAYLGFQSNVAQNYTIILKLDIGSPEDLSEYSRIKRYAYFRNAALRYHKDRLTLNFGIIDMLQFKVQEKFWGHRYLYKSFMDEHRFGSSADIGTQAQYRINNRLSGDLTFSNGEGYTKLQLDNSFKTGLGATFIPIDKLLIRTYYSFIGKDGVLQSTLSLFTGFSISHFKIGGEINYRFNDANETGKNKWGYSFYSMFSFAKRWEVFARYDILTSTKLEGEEYGWNYAKDGSALIAGIQFQPIKNVNIALNYQDWYPYPQNLENESVIYLNLEFKL